MMDRLTSHWSVAAAEGADPGIQDAALVQHTSAPTLADPPGMGPVVDVEISMLDVAGSPRLHGVDPHHVRILAEVHGELPPIVVHRATGRVIDGRHRVAAAAINGKCTIRAVFFEGHENDAFVLAVATNVRHGLPLTLADRRAAAQRIVRTHPAMSDRAIGRAAGLSAKTVAPIRVRSTADLPHLSERIGRDGRVRPLNTAEGRRAAAALMAERPEASMREIAREVGLSAATVRDVRERLRAGEDPADQLPESRNRRKLAAVAPIDSEPAPPDVLGVVRRLSRDPALRYTESGRRLLRWLRQRSVEPRECHDMLDEVAPHCAILVVQVARECAAAWQHLAEDLERRHGETAWGPTPSSRLRDQRAASRRKAL